jgi:uncharacterized membrane protein
MTNSPVIDFTSETSASEDRTVADDNIQAVARLERAAKAKRSLGACVSDGITTWAGSEWSVARHAIWFGGWVILNTRLSPWPRFDPFPFSLLTSVVSLEAIFLTLFVLASQNRLTIEADKRSNLDLQINLLAEQEMTLVLKMLRDLSEHFGLHKTNRSPELEALMARTDISDLAERLESSLGKPAIGGNSPVESDCAIST